MSTNPERTGTWQFMSVAPYVSSPERTRPVAVPDELESFFHVMLFYAIRFLPHTLGNTAQYVAEYFDISQDYGNNRPLCSVVKYWVMRSGDFMMPSLNFVKNSGDPGSPLDTLIYLLLQHFKARYEVLKYESTIQQKKPSKPIPTPPGSTADEVKLARPRLKLRTTTPAWRRGLGADVRTNFNVESNQPSEETRDLAERLNTHDRMSGLFAYILHPENTYPDEWNDVLAVPDQLIAGYECRDAFG
ncbi:uncharacterized protein TRAVEDRAFT_53486 [Trametes versicolor FP-101664 SS1]|uniref:uncharacterized protein n=1 Tax=Trametes versicolor (strain FP-101664) TaxID=717944 RepID=UPI000462419F|nr:uncharacterized protein TRAVEDRAFT_53486 [Trametes versicolor FP-101664 SS1]EIW53071.1 hypothetical protein TRAVEDRAFT_53486 [Trametes versicolor FP-101664 SS1]